MGVRTFGLAGNMSFYDFIVAPVWLAANILLVAAAWRLGRWMSGGERPLYLVLHAMVLSCACILLVSIFLGALGILSAPALIAGVALVATAGWLAVARADRRSSGTWPTSAPSPVGIARRTAGRRWRFRGLVRHRGWLLVWGVVTALYLGHVVERGLLQFPTDWDSLMYHIPFIDHWLSAHAIYVPNCARWADPANNELIGLWMVAPFSGDFLISLNNLPAAAILALGSVMLLDTLGLSVPLCHLGAMLIVSNYAVARQALDAGNDVAVAAYFVAGLAYALRYLRRRRLADFVLASLCTGILSGVKYYALGYAVLLGFLLIGAALLAGRKSLGRLLTIGTVCLMLFGGYWYLRNLWVSGTPIYPKGFTTQTDLLAQRRSATLWSSTLFGSEDLGVAPLTIQAVWKMAGPGHLMAVTIVPSAVVWLAGTGIGLLRRQRRSFAGLSRLLLAGLTIASAVVWGVTPFSVETIPGSLNMVRWGYSPVRFGLCFFALAIVALLLFVNDLTMPRFVVWRRERSAGFRSARWLIPAMLFALSVVQLSMPLIRQLQGDMLISLLIGADIVLVGYALAQVVRSSPHVRYGLAVAALLFGSTGAGWLGEHWHRGYPEHFDRWFDTGLFSRLSQMPQHGMRISACFYRYYPFFGSRRRFWVCRPEYLTSQSALWKHVEEQRITHIVSARGGDAMTHYAGIEEWLQSDPDVFERVDGGEVFTMYRVNATKLKQPICFTNGKDTQTTTALGSAISRRESPITSISHGARR